MSQKKILVVDDDRAVLDWLHAKLGARYRLVSTDSPHNVLPMARETRPDLILCDVDMPGMDGGDVSAALYGDDGLRHIPLLFLTGVASPEAIEALQGQLGGRAAVSKRAPLEQLLARIAALIP
jgi:CheY-like chemotaxis protein